jgi:hypothetical protein
MIILLTIWIALMIILSIKDLWQKNTLRRTIYELEDKWDKRCNKHIDKLKKRFQIDLNKQENKYLSEIHTLNNRLEDCDEKKVDKLRKEINIDKTRANQFQETIKLQILEKNYIKDMLTEKQLQEYIAFKTTLPKR